METASILLLSGPCFSFSGGKCSALGQGHGGASGMREWFAVNVTHFGLPPATVVSVWAREARFALAPAPTVAQDVFMAFS
jgi:hypothetical protein